MGKVTICTDWLATATEAGTPMNSSIGVKRKAPPTPNKPDKKPVTSPSTTSATASMVISAIGR